MLEIQIEKKLPHFLVDVNLTVEDEILVLVGPSGSGKTTILNAIAGLDQPDAGRIILNGQTFYCKDEKPLPTRQRNIGYLFQDYALFPHMTVEKNISYGVKKVNAVGDAERIEQLVSTLGIKHLQKKYPHQISGGEKQRVALARALATEPSLLLLDEPLSALDSKTRLECQDELQRLHEIWKIPFIMVTHDMQEAEKLGDKIIFLESGLIAKTVDKRSGEMIS